MDRARLIDRKHEVQALLRALRARWERDRTQAATRRDRRALDRLQGEIDALADEEHRLRNEIDRTGR